MLLSLTPVYPGGRILSRWGCTHKMLAVSSFLHSSRIIWKVYNKERCRFIRPTTLLYPWGTALFVTSAHLDSLLPSDEEVVCPVALDGEGLEQCPSLVSQTHQAFHSQGHLSVELLATMLQRATAEEGPAAAVMTTAGINLHKHVSKSSCLTRTNWTSSSRGLAQFWPALWIQWTL